jgi:hypothetical protein
MSLGLRIQQRRGTCGVLAAGLLVLALSPWVRSHGEEPPREAASAKGSPETAGPCPVRGKPCALVLHGPAGPSASSACFSDAWSSRLKFAQPGKWTDSNGDGWWETVLEVRLDPTKDCGCARFKVFYEDPVGQWTVDLGNSPTNNGYGGDAGTTPKSAEVQILEGKLGVFSASRVAQHRVDKLLAETLPPLGGRTMEFEVCNQALGIEMLPTSRDPNSRKWKLETLNSRLLFFLGPEQAEPDRETRTSIYAAFNRVIHVISGAPSQDRVGSGAGRVEISLTP